MKRLLLCCFFIVIGISAYCQEQNDSISTQYVSEHIQFMGIPMEGSFDEFRDKVIAKGFRFEMINNNGFTILRGSFADHPVSILLKPNRKNEIYRVQLIFADGNLYFSSWKRISNLYYELKDLLISKYGQPKVCIEKFIGQKPSTDKGKILAVAKEKCTYESIFELYGKVAFESEHMSVTAQLPIGSIGLHIADQVVRLTYTDLQQEMKQQDQNFDDI